MATISYLKQDPDTLPSADELTDVQERHHELLKQAGFKKARRWQAKGGAMLDTATTLYPELTGHDLWLWRKFLPTVVDEDERKDYKFDVPEPEALDHIVTADMLGCFDNIEIWTPQGNNFRGWAARKLGMAKEKIAEFGERIDPMAVGVVADFDGTKHYFQITRWGEALKPVDEIARHVHRVNLQARLAVLLVLAALFVAAVSYYNGIVHFGFGLMIMGTLVSCFLGAWSFVIVASAFGSITKGIRRRRGNGL